MSIKDDKKLIEEFLKHNEIEIIPSVKEKRIIVSVSKVKHTIADLMSLGDAVDMYGEKQKRRTKKKKPDMSKIDKNLIPSSLHEIINLYDSKPEEEK